MVHRINIFLLSIILAIAPAYIYAKTALAGWSITDRIRQGASTVINATKTVVINGSNVVKTSTALIKPTASQVSKILVRGGGGYALSIAVEQLLGAVDWVLDPENNQIVYTEKKQLNCQYMYQFQGKNYCLDQLGQAANEYYQNMGIQNPRCVGMENGQIDCAGLGGIVNQANEVLNPAYDPNAEIEKKTLPLDTVSQKVIDNAESSDQVKAPPSQAVTGAAADEALANDAATQTNVQNQLEANAKTQTNEQAQGDTKPKDPAKPELGSDIALEFPVFCSWAPIVCEAAQTVISFPQTLTSWWDTATGSITEAWTTTKEWMNKEETPTESTVVDIDQTVPVVPDTSYLNWGAYCPFSPGSQTITLENTSAGIDYDLTSWCELASDLRPFVLAAGALMSFFIAAGVVMGRDD